MPGNQKYLLELQIPYQAAGTGVTVRKDFNLQGDWLIDSISFIPDQAVTADNTDYTTVTLTNETDSQALQTRATDVAGGSLVAGTPVDATLVEGSARIVSNGDTFSAEKADTGAGKALGGTFQIALTEVRL